MARRNWMQFDFLIDQKTKIAARSKKKSKASQRLQAITQPQSPLQLVRNSQTPDGAVARASLLDHSKVLKKTTGATGSNNSLKIN